MKWAFSKKLSSKSQIIIRNTEKIDKSINKSCFLYINGLSYFKHTHHDERVHFNGICLIRLYSLQKQYLTEKKKSYKKNFFFN